MQPLADTESFTFTITTSFVCPYFLFLNLGFLACFPRQGMSGTTFPTNACWNGASSWPWVSVTVQHLCVGTQKLTQDTSKLMAFHFMGFIIFFASAKQPLQLEREWKRCETLILMRDTLSVHPLVPVTRFEPSHVNVQPSTGPGSNSEAVQGSAMNT